ncbi:hypothetical protein PVA44_05035 [Entomospira nematocerorum]|uniref:Uncharacterized protein n=1 Tax=Entomospira nematocerorum TaxID=2719987 RepID=A0A968GCA3_9SPIO|nr:hypothetical protein [Entomospira nematocera]NIZ46614.1 hypothetical protein [Entomospira nematocera]WDI33588.1 hypothetical protein PVA44_05035 [Entomospira nematocera]
MANCSKLVQLQLIVITMLSIIVGCTPKVKLPAPTTPIQTSPNPNEVKGTLVENEIKGNITDNTIKETPIKEAEVVTTHKHREIVPVNHPNQSEYILPHAKSPASDSRYEQYIIRWDNVEGVTIDESINEEENGNGNVWLVAVQAVRPGENVVINPKSTGAGTATILFNWFNGEVHPYVDPDQKTGIMKNQAIPLIAPLVSEIYDFNPRDYIVSYELNFHNSMSILLDYHAAINNDTNMNGAGSLYRASTWSGSSENFVAGDTVELVFLLYRTVEDYQWYERSLADNIKDPLENTTVDHFIELQRIPIKLLN